jgi:hypothetical protein
VAWLDTYMLFEQFFFSIVWCASREKSLIYGTVALAFRSKHFTQALKSFWTGFFI